MSTTTTKRAYRCSDADFKQVADSLLDVAREDSANLAPYGITAAWLDALEAAIAAFGHTTIDAFWQGNKMQYTAAKNATRAAIIQHSQRIISCAQQHFAQQRGTFLLFSHPPITRQPDEELRRTARNLAYRTAEYATELAAEGYTATMLADYNAHIASFDQQLDATRHSRNIRKENAHQRIALGNTVYQMLLVLSAKGKLCWVDTSPARYHHYSIAHRRRRSRPKTTKPPKTPTDSYYPHTNP